MIRRPIDPRFNRAILEGRKVTTIREKPWPYGRVQLYNWTGQPYRSKQTNVAIVEVRFVQSIDIAHNPTGEIEFSKTSETVAGRPLWEVEGFNSAKELQEWFRPIVPVGFKCTRSIIRFVLVP